MKVRHVHLSTNWSAGFLLVLMCVPARGEWSAKASATWTYCYVLAECPDTPVCESSDVEILSGCSEVCTVGLGRCAAHAEAEGNIAWRVSGAGFAVGGGGFVAGSVDADIAAVGERVSGTLFRVTGTSSLTGNSSRELAVYRYSGDPSAFEDVAVRSVDELVELGFISPSDVLFRLADSEIPSSFSFDVDVSGIPDEELVVFANGHGVAIPTMSEWGLAVMILLVLSVGTIVFARVRMRSVTA